MLYIQTALCAASRGRNDRVREEVRTSTVPRSNLKTDDTRAGTLLLWPSHDLAGWLLTPTINVALHVTADVAVQMSKGKTPNRSWVWYCENGYPAFVGNCSNVRFSLGLDRPERHAGHTRSTYPYSLLVMNIERESSLIQCR